MATSDDAIRQSVNAHYGRGDLGVAILDAIRDAGGDPEHLTIESLAPYDHFHGGFRAATIALMRLANLPRGASVLDIGGGIGGPARTLAHDLACRVTVLDATQAFCEAGAVLTARAALDQLVTFQYGSATDMPFPDGSFDAVWIQNVGMNIEDKERLFAEIARVLQPGGKVALQEVLAGPVQPVHYPMPWAKEATQSFLVPPDALHALLAQAGLREAAWHDMAALVPPPSTPPVQLLPMLLWGEEAAKLNAANSRRNSAEGRVLNTMVIAERHA